MEPPAMMVLERYVLSGIFRLAVMLLAGLILLALLYLVARYSDYSHDVPPGLLFNLMGVHFMRYLPRLVIVALFAATLLCYMRLQGSRELLAMASAGFGFARHVSLNFGAMALFGAVVATTSFVLSPKVEADYHDLRSQARKLWSSSELLHPGTFYSNGRLSIYFGDRDDTGAMTGGVYTYVRRDDGYVAIVADSARFRQEGDAVSLEHYDGTMHEAGVGSRSRIGFSLYDMPLQLQLGNVHRLESWSLPELIRGGGAAHYAAIYKRVSPVAAALLLPLLALLLVLYSSRWRSQHAVLFAAIIAFFLYHACIDLFYTLVYRGAMPPLPGMLAPHLCLLLLLAGLWSAVREAPYQIRQ